MGHIYSHLQQLTIHDVTMISNRFAETHQHLPSNFQQNCLIVNCGFTERTTEFDYRNLRTTYIEIMRMLYEPIGGTEARIGE